MRQRVPRIILFYMLIDVGYGIIFHGDRVEGAIESMLQHGGTRVRNWREWGTKCHGDKELMELMKT
jgi:hypothetical protein